MRYLIKLEEEYINDILLNRIDVYYDYSSTPTKLKSIYLADIKGLSIYFCKLGQKVDISYHESCDKLLPTNPFNDQDYSIKNYLRDFRTTSFSFNWEKSSNK